MLFRQLFDQDTSTYTYLIADEASRQAVIVDPVFEQFDRDSTLIRELELNLLWAVDTHVHADHVTSLGLMGQRFKARTVLSERSGAVCADQLVKHGDRLAFGPYELEVRETPGHTSGCLSYLSRDSGQTRVFTGDALLIRGCGRTDFQQGNAETLYRSVHEQIFSLPEATLIYPGHDYKGRTVSTVGEELRHNPRLGQKKTLVEFAHIMQDLKLPYPRKMDVSVPSNLECGIPRSAAATPATVDMGWAPITLSGARVPELGAEWLRAHLSEVNVVDVREPDEYRGELGHIAGADLVPLQTLSGAVGNWSKERPVVVVCRSGGRSGKAALALLEQGFGRVASLAGGMLGWLQQSLPVEYGPPNRRGVERQG